MTFHNGQKVRNKYNGEIGTILFANPVGMPDCVVVGFPGLQDGLTMKKSSIEIAQDERRLTK